MVLESVSMGYELVPFNVLSETRDWNFFLISSCIVVLRPPKFTGHN